ncbi:MAG: fatty acid desaturase family protein [Sphingorhabdus sp.]|uniref:fatty acid desaturase family protein n=1 Tax=Sphingorhabdus sp. TaxID=1902408 RepID=UPI003CA760EE
MPAVKAANPRSIFAPEDWAAITRVSPWLGIWQIVHAWAVVAIAAFGTAWAWEQNWLAGLVATPIALALLGGRQLGLAILMHDGAHGLLHPSRLLNNWLGQWPSGAATGSDLHAYRAYHLTHHKFTQQPEDPDLSLSKPFPTSSASLWRKAVRDLTGQTFFKQRSHQFAAALRGLKAMLRGETGSSEDNRDTSAGRALNLQSRSGIDAPVANIEGAKTTARTVARFLLVQLILLAISLAVWGWLPFLLWLVALATTFQLFLRIRNIAEHACTTTGSDDPFSHARTTYAGLIERATVAPYWVNFHSEHHLFMGVPCYSLPRAHTLLGKGGYHAKMTIEPNYWSVLRRVTASPTA